MSAFFGKCSFVVTKNVPNFICACACVCVHMYMYIRLPLTTNRLKTPLTILKKAFFCGRQTKTAYHVNLLILAKKQP